MVMAMRKSLASQLRLCFLANSKYADYGELALPSTDSATVRDDYGEVVSRHLQHVLFRWRCSRPEASEETFRQDGSARCRRRGP